MRIESSLVFQSLWRIHIVSSSESPLRPRLRLQLLQPQSIGFSWGKQPRGGIFSPTLLKAEWDPLWRGKRTKLTFSRVLSPETTPRVRAPKRSTPTNDEAIRPWGAPDDDATPPRERKKRKPKQQVKKKTKNFSFKKIKIIRRICSFLTSSRDFIYFFRGSNSRSDRGLPDFHSWFDVRAN